MAHKYYIHNTNNDVYGILFKSNDKLYFEQFKYYNPSKPNASLPKVVLTGCNKIKEVNDDFYKSFKEIDYALWCGYDIQAFSKP